MSFDHALELIFALPGKMAKTLRLKFVSVIKRYFAGDKSLVAEIEANAVSTGPIAQLARDSEAESPADAACPLAASLSVASQARVNADEELVGQAVAQADGGCLKRYNPNNVDQCSSSSSSFLGIAEVIKTSLLETLRIKDEQVIKAKDDLLETVRVKDEQIFKTKDEVLERTKEIIKGKDELLEMTRLKDEQIIKAKDETILVQQQAMAAMRKMDAGM